MTASDHPCPEHAPVCLGQERNQADRLPSHSCCLVATDKSSEVRNRRRLYGIIVASVAMPREKLILKEGQL